MATPLPVLVQAIVAVAVRPLDADAVAVVASVAVGLGPSPDAELLDRVYDGLTDPHPPEPQAADLASALTALVACSERWAELAHGPLRSHLFRHGVHYARATGDAAASARAQQRLFDFAWLLARFDELPPSDAIAVVQDYAAWQGSGLDDAQAFAAFFRASAAALGRAEPGWPASRILLQLATEYADTSPITRAAESWLATGACDWFWLRRVDRPHQPPPVPRVRVLEHVGRVNGACVLPGERLATCGMEGELRIWDRTSGACVARLHGHGDAGVSGVVALPGERLASWDWQRRIMVWDSQSYQRVHTFTGPRLTIHRIEPLGERHLVSWGQDTTLWLWDLDTGESFQSPRLGSQILVDGRILPDGRLLTWPGGMNGLFVWDWRRGQLRELDWERGGRRGVVVAGERFVRWSDLELTVWDAAALEVTATLRGHQGAIQGARLLADGRLLSWAEDRTLRVWDLASGVCTGVLTGPEMPVSTAVERAGGGVIARERRGRTLVWLHDEGPPSAILATPAGTLTPLELVDGRIAVVDAADNAVQLWDAGTAQPVATLRGHRESIQGLLAAAPDALLSWSFDHTARLWDPQHPPAFAPAVSALAGTLGLADGRQLAWQADGRVRIWERAAGRLQETLPETTAWQRGALTLAGAPLAQWDTRTGTPITPDHTPGEIALAGGATLTWREDGEWDDASYDSFTDLRVLDASGNQIAGHRIDSRFEIEGALWLSGGAVVYWGNSDRETHLWVPRPHAVVRLAAHTNGALELPDGRCLTFSCHGEIALWDVASLIRGGKPKPLAQSPRSDPAAGILGAAQVADGSLVTWSRDGFMRAWDLDTCACRAQVDELDVAVQRPAWLQARLQAAPWDAPRHGLQVATGEYRRPAQERAVFLVSPRAGEGEQAQWHAAGRVRSVQGYPDGAVVAVTDEVAPAFLQLHAGARPATLADLRRDLNARNRSGA